MAAWILAHLAIIVVVVACATAVVVNQRAIRRRAERTLESLSTITDPALARLVPDELFRELLARTARVLDADLASLYLLDGATLVLRSVVGLEGVVDMPLSLAATDGLPGRVVATGAPALLESVAPSDLAVDDLRAHVHSFLGCPLLVEGEVRGVLSLASRREEAFSAEDLRLAMRVAERFAWAVERAEFDASEQAAAATIEENEHRIRTVIEAAPLGIVEAAVDGAVLRWNRAAADILNWPRWLPGAEPAGQLPEAAAEPVAAAASGHRTDGVPATIERQHEGARDADVLISAAPMTDREGSIEGVLVLLDDVTERQQLEQHVRQAQRLEAMARLAGGVAHDFNNLLTVIRGHSEVLLKTFDAKDDRREDVDAIRVATERASELTKQLLMIGRRPSVEPQVIDLHARIRELEPILRRLVSADVDLRVVIGGGLGYVRVDPGDLDQTIMNLLNNARDAMPSGGRVMIETRAIEMRPRGASLAGVTAGRYILLTVADTGAGMSKDVAQHCFDPFFSTKGRGKGTGLGLALVYGTATRAGGHATVESEMGRGTTFRVWFPEVDPASEQPVAAPARRRRRSGRVPTRPCRILLVDDEAPVRGLVRAALEEAGHDLVEASSAEEALTKADGEREAIDVLVSDIALGGMRGDELAVKLRKKWKALRVVLMSGYTDQPMALEPDAFVSKPFALDELVDTVGTIAAAVPARPPAATARTGTRRRAR